MMDGKREDSDAAIDAIKEACLKHGYNQNFTSVLNNPKEASTSLSDFFVREDQHIPPMPQPQGAEEIDLNTFLPYLSRFGEILQRFSRMRNFMKHECDVNPQIDATVHGPSLDTIPDAYFKSEFSLADSGLLTILEDSSPNQTLLLEKLSSQLDVVEVLLINQIKLRSDAIFASLVDIQRLHHAIESACQIISTIRKRMTKVDDDMVASALRVAQLKRKRANCIKLLKFLRMVATVQQTHPTVQLLLSTSDFLGALDLLASTKQALKNELAAIHGFKHLQAQLSEMQNAIEKIMQEDFVRLALGDSHKIDDICLPDALDSIAQDTEAGAEVQLEAELAPLVWGLRRVDRLQMAIQEFRERSVARVRPALRQGVLRVCTELSRETSATDLANWVREQDPDSFVKLLGGVFTSLGYVMQQAKLAHEIIWNALETPFTSSQVGVSSDSPEVSDENAPIKTAATRSAVSDAVVAVAEECHSRAARLLQLRQESISKLTFPEFVTLHESVWIFIQEGEKICARPLRGLRGPLLQLSRTFVDAFHKRRMQALALLLDGETWQSAEVPKEFQTLIDSWANGTVSGTESAESKNEKTDENVSDDIPEDFAEKKNDVDSDSNENTPKKPNKYLLLGKRKIKVVNTILMLLKFTDEYLRIVDTLPMLASDVLTRVVELLKFFNSRSCQLILGAGALQVAGLKSITATHLALASQCLGLVVAEIPFIRSSLAKALPDARHVLLVELDRTAQDCGNHRHEIFSKLVSIMKDRLDFHARAMQKIDWDLEAEQDGVVSPYVQNLSKETAVMHKKLTQTLQKEELRNIFSQINSIYIQRLGEHFSSCQVSTALGRRRMKQDAKYLLAMLKTLKGIDPPGTELIEIIQRITTSKPKTVDDVTSQESSETKLKSDTDLKERTFANTTSDFLNTMKSKVKGSRNGKTNDEPDMEESRHSEDIPQEHTAVLPRSHSDAKISTLNDPHPSTHNVSTNPSTHSDGKPPRTRSRKFLNF